MIQKSSIALLSDYLTFRTGDHLGKAVSSYNVLEKESTTLELLLSQKQFL